MLTWVEIGDISWLTNHTPSLNEEMVPEIWREKRSVVGLRVQSGYTALPGHSYPATVKIAMPGDSLCRMTLPDTVSGHGLDYPLH